jgi:hypothetical protein
VGFPCEWEEVMLAAASEGYIANQYHFIIFLCKCFLHMLAWVFSQSSKDLLIHSRHARWRFEEAFTVWIFTDSTKDFTDCRFDSSVVNLNLRR